MDVQTAIARLRDRADELKQRCDARMASIRTVSKETESDDQRALRNAAQCDFEIAQELRNLAEEIEQD